MKTKVINLYSFDELSEEAQQKAIENLYDINIDYDWWDFTYDDAKEIGLKIEGFDLDRYRHATGYFLEDANTTANLILENHGNMCETYKTAEGFLTDWAELVKKYSDGKDLDRVTEENEYDFDNEADELEQKFLKSLLEDYSIILQKEYEYLTSDECIIETIKANKYTFTINGKLENE